ncbi:hypothetical protein [Ancylomarina sp.]|uniref:hypothetical protein n=1 Tax=Ancylomarina sp. TaxID=1970196 RepID=UPI003569D1BE
MKALVQTLILLFLSMSLLAQDCYTEATQENIKSDYCQLWHGRTFQGTIGDDNQRIEIRFIEISRDSESHFKYHVKGKSRVLNNVCDFDGYMIVKQIMILNEAKRDCHEPDLSGGIIYGSYQLNENPEQKHVGRFTGNFKCMFDKSPYGPTLNNTWFGQEEFNSFYGNWANYDKSEPKYCSWGFQIPLSKNEDLFKHYDKEFYLFNSKYLDKGWKTYVLSNLNTFIKVPKNYEIDELRLADDFIEYTSEEIDQASKEEEKKWWE